MRKTQKVNDFMAKLNNPLKAEMELVREIILGTDDKIAEDII